MGKQINLATLLNQARSKVFNCVCKGSHEKALVCTGDFWALCRVEKTMPVVRSRSIVIDLWASLPCKQLPVIFTSLGWHRASTFCFEVDANGRKLHVIHISHWVTNCCHSCTEDLMCFFIIFLTRWTTRWSFCRTVGVNFSFSTMSSGRWYMPRRAPSYWSQASRWVDETHPKTYFPLTVASPTMHELLLGRLCNTSKLPLKHYWLHSLQRDYAYRYKLMSPE